MHIGENDLILHYYGEMDARAEAQTTSHLGECRICNASYAKLQQVLAAVEAAPPPELPEGFERIVWARLEPTLHRRRAAWLSWAAVSPARLAGLAAVLALVAGAFFAGRNWRETTPPSPTATAAAPLRERVLLVDLGEHLDRSQMMLIELVSAGADRGVDMSSERERAEQLVSANRLYRQTAAATGNAALADVLDQLERVLVDVAASSDELSGARLEEVRQQIERKGLLFKVRVLSSEVRERQKTQIRNRAGQSL
jgi:hypothetical protein